MTTDTTAGPAGTDTPRDQAIKRLKKRREFYRHLVVFTLINGVLVATWAMTDPHGFFWPIFIILGWGTGLVLHAWDAFRGETFSEAQIQREIEHLRRGDGR